MNSEFAVHKLNERGMHNAETIARLFDELLMDISEVCVESRELSLAKTKLEEACFFAKKAMCLHIDNQQL